jgi:heme-degrading monooxygenase HmoA
MLMIIVVFRSRIRPGVDESFYPLRDKMFEIAKSMPGFISYKAFFAEDGERVSIHEWESVEHLQAWRMHPEHVKAQKQGRTDYYEEYTSQVCETQRQSKFCRSVTSD